MKLQKAKEKFDKYWDECNLLLAFGAMKDPRMKSIVIEFAYAMLYDRDKSMRHVEYVYKMLHELY